jgi:hypothetical protein
MHKLARPSNCSRIMRLRSFDIATGDTSKCGRSICRKAAHFQMGLILTTVSYRCKGIML